MMMTSNSNYPPGAEHDPRAPYNQVDTPEKKFDVTVSQTLSKDIKVVTSDYYLEEDEELGHVYPKTENVEWEKEYNEQHFTPLELIKALKEMCTELIHHPTPTKPLYTREHLRHILTECDGWISDEFEVIES